MPWLVIHDDKYHEVKRMWLGEWEWRDLTISEQRLTYDACALTVRSIPGGCGFSLDDGIKQ